MHSVVVRRSRPSQGGPFGISSTHLAPYMVVTMLLTILLMLYFTSLWPFCNYQFVLLSLFPLFHAAPRPPGPPAVDSHLTAEPVAAVMLICFTVT